MFECVRFLALPDVAAGGAFVGVVVVAGGGVWIEEERFVGDLVGEDLGGFGLVGGVGAREEFVGWVGWCWVGGWSWFGGGIGAGRWGGHGG